MPTTYRRVSACVLLAGALATTGCSGDEAGSDPDGSQGAAAVPAAITMHDPADDVGGARSFGGKYAPADILEFSAGADSEALVATWRLGAMLKDTDAETQLLGLDAFTRPGGEPLFSVRVGETIAITDAAGFAHPCPDATTDTTEGTVQLRAPLSCLGDPDELAMSASAAVSSLNGDLVAFDLVSASDVLVVASNTTKSPEKPAGSAAEEDPSARVEVEGSR